MKIATLLLLIVMARCFSSSAQINNAYTRGIHSDYKLMAAAYQKKSHNQKATSTVLGIGGTVMHTIGIGLATSSLSGFLNPVQNSMIMGLLLIY